jgi:diguanylate cyclase (GGDEF)-like protein
MKSSELAHTRRIDAGRGHERLALKLWPWTALGVTLSIVLLLGGLLLARSYDRVTAEQVGRLQTQALIVSETMSRQLRSMDNALRAVRSDLAEGRSAQAISPRQLQNLSNVMPGLKGMLATDPDGKVIMAAFDGLLGQNFSHRDYFSKPRNQPDFTVLYVSSPFLSIQRNYSINLTKAVADREGKFAGVVSANLDPSYFEMLARSVLFAPDMRVSLVHGDGKIFVDTRNEERGFGKDIGDHRPLFSQHIRSGHDGSLMVDDAHAGTSGHMTVYRTILPPDLSMDAPLVVSVSRETDAIYGVWWDDLITYAFMFILLCAGSCSALWLGQQRKAAVARAFRELADAADLQQRTGKLAKVGGWQLELATQQMTCTDEMFDIHALRRTGLPSMATLLASLCPESRPAFELAIEQATTHGQAWALEVGVLSDRGKLWVRTQGQAVVESGTVVRLRGASQDVTERVESAAKLAAAHEKLQIQATTDELTGVGNRRRFDQQLQAEWSRCQRSGLPLGMLMLDVDHFKRYNDTYGHLGGDEVLRQVSTIVGDCAQRSGELVARYGGEEFAVLLPGSDINAARMVASDILTRLAQENIPHRSSPSSSYLTVSIGIASMVPGSARQSLALVQAADTALYNAKRNGRNRAEPAYDLQSH